MEALEMKCPENELNYLSEERSIIAFRIPENVEKEDEEVEDDFYELTLNEVKRLYKHLQESRKELEEAPLLTKKKREELEQERSVVHTSSVVRVEFPDRTVLQGVFLPYESIAALTEVVSYYVRCQGPFTLFTAPPRAVLTNDSTFQSAGLVPTGKVYFKSGEDCGGAQPYLKDEVLQRLSSYQAASRAATLSRSKDGKKETKVSPDNGMPSHPERVNCPTQPRSKDPASLLRFLSKPSSSFTSSFKPS